MTKKQWLRFQDMLRNGIEVEGVSWGENIAPEDWRTLKAARDLIAKLPRTADDVIVVPGMDLFCIEPGGEHVGDCYVAPLWEKRDNYEGLPTYVQERSCYSTREGAEEARTARAEEA